MSREYVIQEDEVGVWARLTINDAHIVVPYRGTEEEIQAKFEEAIASLPTEPSQL